MHDVQRLVTHDGARLAAGPMASRPLESMSRNWRIDDLGVTFERGTSIGVTTEDHRHCLKAKAIESSVWGENSRAARWAGLRLGDRLATATKHLASVVIVEKIQRIATA